MERNKYNKATRLLKRIDALKGICIIEKIDSFELTFDGGGGCFFCVDKELSND